MKKLIATLATAAFALTLYAAPAAACPGKDKDKTVTTQKDKSKDVKKADTKKKEKKKDEKKPEKPAKVS